MAPPRQAFSAALIAALLLTAPWPALADFSLDTSGPDWDYTSADLANTTSAGCKTAYGASIACTDTLQGIVASMRPAFNPQAADLDAMCTSGCSGALASYVAAVKSACGAPGDLADEAQGNNAVPKDPVWVVGEVFQYAFDRACSKDGSGNYCYLGFKDQSPNADFDCSDTCTLQFFTAAHNDPGSAWFFNYYFLVPQSSWWEQEFQQGWQTVQSCSAGGPSANGTTASGTATEVVVASTASAADQTVMATAAAATTTATTAAVTSTATTAAVTARSSSAAAGLGRRSAGAWVGLGVVAALL